MSITTRLCRELEKLVGQELVRCYENKIDFKRLDTYMLMKQLKHERWEPYYTSSIYIDEDKGIVSEGDIAVPTEKKDEMIDKLKKFKCRVKYTHKHRLLGTMHVHFTCRIRGREKSFAELITW